MNNFSRYRQEQLAYLRKIESEAEPCALCKEKPEEYDLGKSGYDFTTVFGCENCNICVYCNSVSHYSDDRFSIQPDIENIEKWNSVMGKKL